TTRAAAHALLGVVLLKGLFPAGVVDLSVVAFGLDAGVGDVPGPHLRIRVPSHLLSALAAGLASVTAVGPQLRNQSGTVLRRVPVGVADRGKEAGGLLVADTLLARDPGTERVLDRKSTRLNSSHVK